MVGIRVWDHCKLGYLANGIGAVAYIKRKFFNMNQNYAKIV